VKKWYPIILLLSAIAIAIAVIIIENPMRSRVDDVADGTFSPGFDSGEVERLQITQLLSGTELKRDGERWLVSESVTPIKDELLSKEGRKRPEQRWFRADRGRVVSALGSFGGLPEGVVVSTNSEKRALYHVETTGLRVRLIGKSGEIVEDVIVGKNGPDLASNYVRRPDADEVYLVSRPLTGVFSPSALDWRERKLWMLKPADIATVSVSSKEGSFEARRGEDGFDRIASALAQVSADGFPRDPDMEPGDEFMTLRVEYEGGEPLTLRIYEEDDGRYPATLEGVEETYMLTKEFVKSLPKNPKER
jgi:hypothetical protein